MIINHARKSETNGLVTKWRCLLECGHVVTIRTTGSYINVAPVEAECELCIPDAPEKKGK